MKISYTIKSSILFLIIILFASSVSAWARHDQMTEEIVKDLGWLDRFENVTVTEYLYDDNSINDIKIRYYNPEPGKLGVDEFYFHALYEPVLYFKGVAVGGKISAREILADFSDEPDWEMDQNLELSWMQGFSGESQGYRHMYYPTGSFHVPMGFVSQGKTPERVQHFYDLAKFAFERGDTYWGFRFLARSLHYVEDMAQPYHTRQFYWKYVDITNPYKGTIQNIKNYHFTYESYIANRFRLEQQDVIPKQFISALRYSLPVETNSPYDLAKYVALRSYWRSSVTWQNSIDFFGKKYMSGEGAIMSSDEFFAKLQQDDEISQRFNSDVERRMVLAGKAAKSFLEFARKDLNLDEYEP